MFSGAYGDGQASASAVERQTEVRTKVVDKRYGKRTVQELTEFKKRRFLHSLLDAVESHEFYGEAFAFVLGSLKDKHWEPVLRAFSETGLNPKDPYCWAELLRLFATVHYKPGARGRKKYAQAYDEQFARDLLAVSQEKKFKSKSQLAGHFLKHALGRRREYSTLKRKSGVLTAIREMEKRQKKDWLSFANDVVSNSASELEHN
jgi:hypothetical protein